MKSVFIAFEGIDGCGKSTQIKKLVEHVFNKDKHNHIVLTRNPYKDTNIRSILREDDDPLSKAEKLADLFINDRKKHVEEVILPNLKDNMFIISDRYKLSTITYQSAQGIDMQYLIEKHTGLPVPNITFIIDVSSKVANERMKKDNPEVRGKEHKFEANLGFLEMVRLNHHKAKNILKNENIFIINGDRTPDEIFNEIKVIFDKEIDKLKTQKNELNSEMKTHVVMVIKKEDKFLFIERPMTKKILPGAWSFASGRPKEGESPFETAIREAREELDIEIEPIKIFAEKTIPEFSSHLIFVLCKIKRGEPKINAPNEIENLKWMTFEEFFTRHKDNEIGHGLVWLRQNPKIWESLETSEKGIHKIAAVVIQNNKFLMVRKKGKDVWTSLGGKPEGNETEQEALVREIKEEISCDAEIVEKIGDFTAKAIFDDATVKLSTYLVKLKGDILLQDNELEEVKFIPKNYKSLGIKFPSSIEEQIIQYCVQKGLLNW